MELLKILWNQFADRETIVINYQNSWPIMLDVVTFFKTLRHFTCLILISWWKAFSMTSARQSYLLLVKPRGLPRLTYVNMAEKQKGMWARVDQSNSSNQSYMAIGMGAWKFSLLINRMISYHSRFIGLFYSLCNYEWSFRGNSV